MVPSLGVGSLWLVPVVFLCTCVLRYRVLSLWVAINICEFANILFTIQICYMMVFFFEALLSMEAGDLEYILCTATYSVIHSHISRADHADDNQWYHECLSLIHI